MEDENPLKIETSNDARMTSEKMEEEEPLFSTTGPIELSFVLLGGVVELCHREHLLSSEIVHIFNNNHTSHQDRNYVHLYRTHRLTDYDHSKSQINIMDHRKLTSQLIQRNPDRYIMSQLPYDLDPEVKDFLAEIYSTDEQTYEEMWRSHVERYHQHWWGAPLKLNPLVDPPLRFYETKKGRALRVQREEAIRI